MGVTGVGTRRVATYDSEARGARGRSAPSGATLPEQVFAAYRARPRSEQIATAFALDGILRWARRCAPARMLDYGSGLGTVTALLTSVVPRASIVTVERHPDFRLPTDRHTLADALDSAPYGLVVVDDALDTHEAGRLVLRGLARRAVLVLEGNRDAERGALLGMLRAAGRRHCAADWKPADRSKGYRVIRCEPTRTERVWFAAVRVREGLRDVAARRRGVRPGWRRRDVDPAA